MNTTLDQVLLSKIHTLSPQQLAEVEDFVDFLSAKACNSTALDRLLAVVPALHSVHVPPMNED